MNFVSKCALNPFQTNEFFIKLHTFKPESYMSAHVLLNLLSELD